MSPQFKIRMSDSPVPLDSLYLGYYKKDDTYYGPAWVATKEATREEFVAQYGEGEMTQETREYLDSHPTLYFYHVKEFSMETTLLAMARKQAEE